MIASMSDTMCERGRGTDPTAPSEPSALVKLKLNSGDGPG